MGMHPKGKLFYGYSLGSDDDGWKGLAEAGVSDTNPYGFLKPPWYDAEFEEIDEDEEERRPGVAELITKVLYDAIPDAPEVEYDWQRDEPVKAHYGVWLESHAHCDYPAYVLTAHEITAYQGDATLTISDMHRGRSAAYFECVDEGGHRFPLFMTDLLEVVRALDIRRGTVAGRWVVCKRGQNYGVRLADPATETTTRSTP
jgi:hypothetical protein